MRGSLSVTFGDSSLPEREALEINLSVCFADSSPDRGATGESVVVMLDEQSFLHS